MQSEYSIRPATLDDLPKIVEVEQRVHVSPWNLEHFKAELEKPYCRFLILTDDETDSQVVAYVVGWFMFEECQILNLAVDLPHRGLGFAKYLVRKLADLAGKNKINRIVLDVRKSNQAAIQLYQSLGFSITHVRKEFYQNKEDAYQMSLFLEEELVKF